MPDKIPSLRQIDHRPDNGIRIYRNDEPDDYPAHWHMAYEIIMPEDNTYTVIVEGISYELYPGDVILIPSGTVHELYAPESGRRWFFLVDRSEVTAIDRMASGEYSFYPCMYVRYDAKNAAVRAVSDAAFGAISEYERGDVLSYAALRQYIGLLLIGCARLNLNKSEAMQPGTQRHTQQQILFSDICEYISAHCSERLTPDEVADKSGYSRFYFGRLFASFTGMNFHDYLLLQRLNLAKRMLYNTDLPITDVALRSGFGSIATFNRAFSNRERMSPTQYRMLQQKLQEP